jgi:hypothetical protein
MNLASQNVILLGNLSNTILISLDRPFVDQQIEFNVEGLVFSAQSTLKIEVSSKNGIHFNSKNHFFGFGLPISATFTSIYSEDLPNAAFFALLRFEWIELNYLTQLLNRFYLEWILSIQEFIH